MIQFVDLSRLIEPRWRRVGRGRAGVPLRMHRWLADPGSLTARLVAACPGDFRVQLLSQGWERPLASERKLLGLRRNALALVREVELRCNEESWVFARTVIPASSLRGAARRLTLLGDRPLGAVLFADPTTRRGRLEVARLDRRHGLFHRACVHHGMLPSALWGRRTLFRYRHKPLLVNEIFLPEIADAPS